MPANLKPTLESFCGCVRFQGLLGSVMALLLSNPANVYETPSPAGTGVMTDNGVPLKPEVVIDSIMPAFEWSKSITVKSCSKSFTKSFVPAATNLYCMVNDPGDLMLMRPKHPVSPFLRRSFGEYSVVLTTTRSNSWPVANFSTFLYRISSGAPKSGPMPPKLLLISAPQKFHSSFEGPPSAVDNSASGVSTAGASTSDPSSAAVTSLAALCRPRRLSKACWVWLKTF